ncbi:MAG: SDR family oxidoreductase [Pseudomonadota bacterium]
MAGRLTDKKAFVTAAGAGIGRAIAIAFAAEGAHVIATNRTVSRLEGLQSCGVAEVRELDVTDAESMWAAAEEAGPVSILVNCAGVVQSNTVLSCSEADLEVAIDVNLKGTINAIRAFLPQMLEIGGGTIVNIGSIISSLKGAPDRFAYGTTKGAINGLTRSIANDFSAKGIRINTICPGTTETESMTERIAAAPDPEAARTMFSARHPVGRIGKPEEIAALAVHLAGDESSFLTGQTLTVDGGWTA